MIASTRHDPLAPGVRLDAGRLEDGVRARPGRSTPAALRARARRAPARRDRERARGCVRAAASRRSRRRARFVWHLNASRSSTSSGAARGCGELVDWLALAARLRRQEPAPGAARRRRALDTRSVAAGASRAASRRSRPASCSVAVIATVAGRPASPSPAPAGCAVPSLVGLGTGLGLGLHEAAHAALLRGVPSALVHAGPAHVCAARRRSAPCGGRSSLLAARCRRRARRRARRRGAACGGAGARARRLPAGRARSGAHGRRRRREGRVRALRAFLLGTLAVGVVAYAARRGARRRGTGGRSRARHRARAARARLASPCDGRTTATTFGAGSLLLAVAGGLANRRCRARSSGDVPTARRSRRLTAAWSGRSSSCW